MKKSLDDLSAEELHVLARIKCAVTANVISAAAALGCFNVPARGSTPFCLALKAPGCDPAYICFDGKDVKAFSGGARPSTRGRSLILRFSSARSAVSVLSGGGGTVLPIPVGRGAFAALRFFRQGASKAPLLISDPATPQNLKAHLLAAAALYGVSQAATDPGLAERLSEVPDGIASVEAPGSFSYSLEKRGTAVRVLDEVSENPQVRLIFKDPSAAVAVFTGRRPAVIALGSGEVVMEGLLPLIQGLFSVLDRLSEYLAVQIGKGDMQ